MNEDVSELLSQETRYKIVQAVLGHPKHLMSMAEIEEVVSVHHSTAKRQVRNLIDAGVLEKYVHRPNELAWKKPVQFYGFSEDGIRLLQENNLLAEMPELRVQYDEKEKSERVLRHERAKRPDLPPAVKRLLTYYEGEIEDGRR